MHNRRKFIVQTSLAAAAVAFLKPLKSAAITPASASFTSEKISILNVGDLFGNSSGKIDIAVTDRLQSALQKENCHSLLVSAGNTINAATTNREQHIHQLKSLRKTGLEAVLPGKADLVKGEDYYNELVNECNVQSLSINNNAIANQSLLPYHIFQKGNIKAGMIGNDAVAKSAELVNETARYLKENAGCNLIILLHSSNHGSNQINNEVIEFACLTQHVHAIISPCKAVINCATLIAKNADQHEVIISFASNESIAPQRMEITYNNKMEMTNLAIYPVV